MLWKMSHDILHRDMFLTYCTKIWLLSWMSLLLILKPTCFKKCLTPYFTGICLWHTVQYMASLLKESFFSNNFLRRSHSLFPCSLFHKIKSAVPFKDSKNSNLISTFSLLHHFWLCPLLSSNMSLSLFWVVSLIFK